MPGNLLSVRRLSVDYGSRQVLHGINLSIGRGEAVGLQGRSGSGKSTLALALLGVLPITAMQKGEIVFHGRAMAPVFQEAIGALHPMMTAGEQIMEAIRARIPCCSRERKERAEAALERVGLSAQHFLRRWPHELSGGERQRVLLAQAISGEPDFLVADEPTASLDERACNLVLGAMLELRKRQSAGLLFISHSRRVVESLGGRRLHMNEGCLTEA